MTERLDALHQQLADLGARIQRKLDELESEGVGQADARRKAIDMQVEQKRLAALAKARREGSPHPQRDTTLADEIEVFLLEMRNWLASIDKGY